MLLPKRMIKRERERVSGAEQVYSFSKAKVKLDRACMVTTEWIVTVIRARLCGRPEISPESNSVQTLTKVLRIRLETEVPSEVYTQAKRYTYAR